MAIQDRIFGKPLATSDERAEHIGVSAGIPIFGLDALTSAAYGPEQALLYLIPLGLLGIHFLIPIISSILILLVIVFFSYRQTIAAYPNGGGSYTVATENLGEGAGLLAAAALMIDYILTAAVGISAGVTAVTSVESRLLPYTLPLCLLILAILAVVNLRGVKDTGAAFILPTFLFIGTLLILVGVGVFKTIAAGGHPQALAEMPPPTPAHGQFLGLAFVWLIMKAFSSGCAAMTGVEAVSNGVMAFSEPRAKKAQWTLTVIIAILIVLLFGTSWLAKHYGIMAMEPDDPQFSEPTESAGEGCVWPWLVLSGDHGQCVPGIGAECKHGVCRFSAADPGHCDARPPAACVHSARTAAAVFAWCVCADRLYRRDPDHLQGSNGQVDSAVCHWRVSGVHVVAGGHGRSLEEAGGGTKAGRMAHVRQRHRRGGDGADDVIVLASKFLAGAWVTALLVPTLILLMHSIKKHYSRVAGEMKDMTPINLDNLEEPVVVIPMAGWNRISEKALRFGLLMSKDIKVVHVHSEEEDHGIEDEWNGKMLEPLRGMKMHEPELVTISSNFRFIISPLMDYILHLEAENPGRKVAVLLPELVVRHWWENLLHNQRVQLLKLLLLVRGNQRIVVVNIPWYL